MTEQERKALLLYSSYEKESIEEQQRLFETWVEERYGEKLSYELLSREENSSRYCYEGIQQQWRA